MTRMSDVEASVDLLVGDVCTHDEALERVGEAINVLHESQGDLTRSLLSREIRLQRELQSLRETVAELQDLVLAPKRRWWGRRDRTEG